MVSDRPDSEGFFFFLLPDFSMMAFAAAMEPLRIANRMLDCAAYRWRLLSADGEPVKSSADVQVAVNGAMEDLPPHATLFVCGGINLHLGTTRHLLTWLRRQERRGVRLGAICTGAYVLARAGLLNDCRCTIHWENQAAFAEEFPQVSLTNRIFEIDGKRLTCAGGMASADMMLYIIDAAHGANLASLVSDQMLYVLSRTRWDEQRLSVPARIGVRHPKLVSVIRKMEDNLEEPISPATLARDAAMSTRQMERLFRRYVNCSPKRYYMELRLRKARSLLLQTDMSVINVALACGFASPSHFSKCYRNFFHRIPYRERGVPRNAMPHENAPHEAVH